MRRSLVSLAVALGFLTAGCCCPRTSCAQTACAPVASAPVRHDPCASSPAIERASGERIALEVVRHHRLLELYLAETLGYPWDQVHDEAEKLEHHVSDELEARMRSRLFGPVAMTYAAEPEGTDSRIVCRLAVDASGPLARARAHALAWGDLVMMRRQLLNLKALAERDARAA